MMYPASEYAYVDDYDQATESYRHVYAESNEVPPATVQMTFDGHHQQQQHQYRAPVINGSQPLAKCSVLYLGTAISSAGQRGIDAIQEPLSRRYPVDGKEAVRGIEAWLAVYDNGLQLQFARDPSVVIFYPIRSLVYCASIRFATRTQTGAEFPNGWRFVPLDSPAAARMENTRNPPLFAVTFRRTRHLPVDECFCFVTKTRQAALALVQACFSAYQATEPQQDCSKVPLYFKVDDYGSKNKEIDSEIRIVPAPDRDRTLDYQTNTEGAGFFYKTDRVPIDSWQLWEHYKHEADRSSPANSRTSSSRSSSSSSCSSRSSTRTRSSRHYSRRGRHRRSKSPSSISAIPPQQTTLGPSASQSAVNYPGATSASLQQAAMDPYAPAPNLIRVERIKDVNSGQDVFIRWVSETNEYGGMHDEQQMSSPQQAYSSQPPNMGMSNYDHQTDREPANDIERLAMDDEYLRKSLLFNRPLSPARSNHEKKKKRSRREKKTSLTSQKVDYEVVNGFFEDRQGRKRPIKLDGTRVRTVKDYRHPFNQMVNSSAPSNDRRRASSFIRSPIQDQQQQQQQFAPPVLSVPPAPPQMPRPFGRPFLPRGAPFYPSQPFSTTPLFSRPNFMNLPPMSRPPVWYRPMY